MNKWWTLVSLLLVLIIVGVLVLIVVPAPSKAPAPASTATTTSQTVASIADTITVDAPLLNANITSPLTITGRARGTWYFEASAPVKLLDQSGAPIAQGVITAQGDWMTTDFVPFSGSLTFAPQPAGSTGTLVLKNDNPSGDPTKEKTLSIPVAF